MSSGVGVRSPCHWYKSKKQGQGGERGARGKRARGTRKVLLLLPVASSLSPWAGEREAGEEMGEMAVAGYGMVKALRASVIFDTPCGALLRELEVRFFS